MSAINGGDIGIDRQISSVQLECRDALKLSCRAGRRDY